MRNHAILLLVLAPLALGSTATVAALTAGREDEEGVRAALQFYLDGHATGDASIMARAFHPEAKLFWIRDGKLNQRTLAEYLSGFTGAPAEDEDQRQRRIAQTSISGTAASAMIELDYPGAYIVDYMSLLKIQGEWKIVNKIFDVELKESD